MGMGNFISEAERKSIRILELYTRLIEGGVINKAEEAERYGVTQRSIQRDIKDLRAFFSETEGGASKKVLVYNYRLNGYYLVLRDEGL